MSRCTHTHTHKHTHTHTHRPLPADPSQKQTLSRSRLPLSLSLARSLSLPPSLSLTLSLSLSLPPSLSLIDTHMHCSNTHRTPTPLARRGQLRMGKGVSDGTLLAEPPPSAPTRHQSKCRGTLLMPIAGVARYAICQGSNAIIVMCTHTHTHGRGTALNL